MEAEKTGLQKFEDALESLTKTIKTGSKTVPAADVQAFVGYLAAEIHGAQMGGAACLGLWRRLTDALARMS